MKRVPLSFARQTTSVGFASTAIPRDERYVHDANDANDANDGWRRRPRRAKRTGRNRTEGDPRWLRFSRGHVRVFARLGCIILGVCVCCFDRSRIKKTPRPVFELFQKKSGVWKKASSTWENQKYPNDFASILPRFFLSERTDACLPGMTD